MIKTANEAPDAEQHNAKPIDRIWLDASIYGPD